MTGYLANLFAHVCVLEIFGFDVWLWCEASGKPFTPQGYRAPILAYAQVNV